MLSKLSIFCLIISAAASASVMAFNPHCATSPRVLFQDSSDSILKIDIQASIKKYEQIISSYNGKEFSRDSLLAKLQETTMRASSDSQEIKKTLASFQKTFKAKDTPYNQALFTPFFRNLKTGYADLISTEASIVAVTSEVAVINSSIKEMEPGYLAARQTFARIIPDNYVGKLNLVYKGKAYTVFITDSKAHNVTISKSAPSGRTLKEGWSSLLKTGAKPIAIFNGGMFNPDFSATGLLIENAQKVSDVNINERTEGGNFFLIPNGIFLVDTSNNFHVLETREFIQKFTASKYAAIKSATQSGPMLLVKNRIHRSFTNGSANLNIRNAVGTNSKFPHRVLFVISDDRVNFYDFAVLFKDLLGCDNALYLDGVVSRMYIDYKGIKTGKLDGDLHLGPLITISQKK